MDMEMETDIGMDIETLTDLQKTKGIGSIIILEIRISILP